jgi:hypothetical protein
LELNALRAVLWVSLGEVCHSQIHYVMTGKGQADYGSTGPDSGVSACWTGLHCPYSQSRTLY